MRQKKSKQPLKRLERLLRLNNFDLLIFQLFVDIFLIAGELLFWNFPVIFEEI